MAHVTFIHGISNKPPADDLCRIWQRALTEAPEAIGLGDQGVSCSMVYWADLLYGSPLEDLTAYESALENTAEAIDAAGDARIPNASTAEEARFLIGLRSKLTSQTDAALDDPKLLDVLPQPQAALERIPLPWFIKRKFMAAFLRDVHHYLFDVEFAPDGGQRVRIQKTIRERFVRALCAPAVSHPHVVVSHSMGTVIAYDCLKRVESCNAVDALITIGSPLGIDEVQDKLQPGWTRHDGFPVERVKTWTNISDPLDPVCGFDPAVANDYQLAGKLVVEDVEVHNDGVWRHSATKYLRQPAFCRALRRALEL